MKLAALSLAFVLTGCAMTPGGFLRKPAAETFESSKTPKEWAQCVIGIYRGVSDIRNDGEDHYWLLFGPMGDPWNRWDFHRTPTGSRAELRVAIRINPGTGAVRECAKKFR